MFGQSMVCTVEYGVWVSYTNVLNIYKNEKSIH